LPRESFVFVTPTVLLAVASSAALTTLNAIAIWKRKIVLKIQKTIVNHALNRVQPATRQIETNPNEIVASRITSAKVIESMNA
jgi:hypothetical protein